MLVPWTPLSSSRRERSLQRLAQGLAFAAAVALGLAALRGDAADPAPLLAAIIVATAGAIAGRRVSRESLEVAVDDAGRFAVRPSTAADGLVEQGLQCVFAAPWLITLRCGTMWVRIWPDSVPRDVFRRFWVHVRWNPGRSPAEPTAATAPGQER